MRLKDITEFCPVCPKDAHNGMVAFVPMESLRYDAISQQEISLEVARGKYTFFADGDLLFAKVTPCFENGNIAVANNLKGGIGFGSSEIFVLRAKPGLNNRYLFYVVQASPFLDGGCATMCGVGGLKRMSPLFPRIFELDVPSEEAQLRIVAYLDERMAAIDARIVVLERKIAAYRRLRTSIINHTITCGLDPNVRMKDSGVDWIGKEPEGWMIKRIKDDYFLKGRIGWQGLKANEFIDEGPWLITGTDFDNGKVDWSRCYHISEERYRLDLDLQIHEGDLLVTKDGTVGKLAYIDQVPGLCSLNSHLLLMRPVKRGIDNRFMYWVLSSNVFRHYIEYESNGSTMQSLSQEAVSRFSYSAPEIEEQLKIAKYLDDECVKIDRKVELVAKEIELYRKLKRSLVNEVVTGKRKVA